MRTLWQAYRFLNLISVDVAAGAVVCAYFFACILKVAAVSASLIELGLIVWIIYTADHLMDVYFLDKEAATQRHRLHQRNFGVMAILVAMAMLIVIILMVYIQPQVLKWGLILAALVFLYLIFQRHINPFKELVVALLYSTGVLLPALSIHATAIAMPVMLLVLTFVLSAFINLLILSCFEWREDRRDRRRSIVTIVGLTSTRRLIAFLYAVQGMVFLMVFTEESFHAEAMILVSMNMVMLFVFLQPERFRQGDVYRQVLDLVFLIPLMILI